MGIEEKVWEASLAWPAETICSGSSVRGEAEALAASLGQKSTPSGCSGPLECLPQRSVGTRALVECAEAAGGTRV